MDSEQLLRQNGLRVTRQRLAVLAVLGEGGHPTVDEIVQRARKRVGSLSTQAVYNVLTMLDDAGLARRIEPAGSNARFEARVGDNHHHLVCRDCGQVEDVDCAVGEVPCLAAADSHGFVIDEAEVIYWGRCPRCAAALSS
ncbi:Fur family transcriptional regulator [Stackebrandtia nassauensis]|uniref:Ferric uptake regulator, Fur family n=1 Tax=Stackebrandtia nassauensis (strain DSM 44728 / CIP 108903 / NRRL B-16338 / NBRC 102104 / LLR-40K-21) TaxID=446470 RepID=D3PZA1_STANL|nr:Fur family transcriptional regulator [Stackebrandtia nassauensis]ADD41575.1 ferric uptake regulator, Fur family [Stackebrandtia nassauensis DSM 44728]